MARSLIPSPHYYLHILYTSGPLSSPLVQFGASDLFLPSLPHLSFPHCFLPQLASNFLITIQLSENIWGEKNLPMEPPTLFLFLLDSRHMGNNGGSVGG